MIVLDSSFLVAFHNATDTQHSRAMKVMKRVVDAEWGQALLPEYVFLEVVTVLSARAGAAVAVDTGRVLLAAREVTFVYCSEHFADAVEAFGELAKVGLSFADATIVAIARRYEAPVATFDRDFRKAGVQVVS